MNNTTVPMSKFQMGQQTHIQETMSPNPGELHEARCVILDVYDQEVLADSEAPLAVKKQLERFPNKLYAKVRLHDGRILFRPFKDTHAQVYSTYGNSAVLEGHPAKLVFNSTKVEEGQIILTDELTKQPVSIPLAVETWDIGILV